MTESQNFIPQLESDESLRLGKAAVELETNNVDDEIVFPETAAYARRQGRNGSKIRDGKRFNTKFCPLVRRVLGFFQERNDAASLSEVLTALKSDSGTRNYVTNNAGDDLPWVKALEENILKPEAGGYIRANAGSQLVVEVVRAWELKPSNLDGIAYPFATVHMEGAQSKLCGKWKQQFDRRDDSLGRRNGRNGHRDSRIGVSQ